MSKENEIPPLGDSGERQKSRFSINRVLGALIYCMFVAVALAIAFDVNFDLVSIYWWSASIFSFEWIWLTGIIISVILMVVLFYMIIRVLSQMEEKRRQRDLVYELYKMEVKRRRQASLAAQLTKADFDFRLTNFVSNNVEPGELNQESLSRAEYWESEPFSEPTLPKSVGFIRQLLMRISQLVHGRNGEKPLGKVGNPN